MWSAFAKFGGGLGRHLSAPSKFDLQLGSIITHPLSKLEPTLRANYSNIAQDHVDGEGRLSQANKRLINVGRFHNQIVTMPEVVRDRVSREDVAIYNQN